MHFLLSMFTNLGIINYQFGYEFHISMKPTTILPMTITDKTVHFDSDANCHKNADNEIVHIVLFSGGLASFETAKRVISDHDKNKVLLWFFDTLIEDQDTYRFINDCENYFDLQIERLLDGRNIWEVFRDERFIGNSQKCVCNRVLKRQLLEKTLKNRFPMKNVILYFGLEYNETTRRSILLSSWALKGYKVGIPLQYSPHLDRKLLIELVNETHIPIPRMYKLGFVHNNCGGGCVKAGIKQWTQLFNLFPERFMWHEREELITREYLNKDVSILRDRHDNQTKPLTLENLRKRLTGIPTHKL